jgi:hypothetical protein
MTFHWRNLSPNHSGQSAKESGIWFSLKLPGPSADTKKMDLWKFYNVCLSLHLAVYTLAFYDSILCSIINGYVSPPIKDSDFPPKALVSISNRATFSKHSLAPSPGILLTQDPTMMKMISARYLQRFTKIARRRRNIKERRISNTFSLSLTVYVLQGCKHYKWKYKRPIYQP